MALLSVDQVTQQIINQLKLLDPAVSAEVGTPERKLIEATAELIASQQVDFTVLNSQTDLSSLSGGRIDAYLAIYNFGRQQATPSYGTVTFGRATPAAAPITIPQGTQVIANLDNSTFPQLTFITTQTVVLEQGSTSISAPVQCTIAGTIGNIEASKIVGFGGLAPITGISTVTNAQAFSGGTDEEDDATYVARFQNTFLRNISGTTDMFLALAVSLNGITKANVVGPISRYQEYVQIPAAPDVAQQTSGGYDPGISVGTFTVTIASPAVFTLNNHGLVAGDVVYLTTTGSLPTGLSASTVYYVIAAGLTTNNFELSATYGGSAINTSGTQSGTHTLHSTVYKQKRTTAKSTIPYSQYTYPSNYYLTDGTLDPATAIFYRPGVDYVFNTPPIKASTGLTQTTDTPTSEPNITFLRTSVNGGDPTLVPGNVYLLEHAYLSKNSRNNIGLGITNCVDVFVNGENPTTVDSEEIVPTSTNALQNTNSALWTYQHPTATTVINFKRKIDGRSADVGSLVQPLYWQPVLDVPDSIQVGSDTYYKANYYNSSDSTYYNQYDGVSYTVKAHYCVVEEVNSYYGTIRARSGIEWFQVGTTNNYLNGALVGDNIATSSYTGVKIETLVGTQFSIVGYTYDKNVADLQAIMEKNKQVTTDVLVHRTKYRYFRPIVTIMYSFGATQSVVNASIIANLQSFFENQYYGTAIQLSDILQTIHNTPGVDNVRWTNQSTLSGHTGVGALEEVNADGSSLSGGPTYIYDDFYIQDNELADSPTSNQVTITVRAQNTWTT